MEFLTLKTNKYFKVNNKKNKIIVFNKAGRKILENFKFQNYDIECVSNYKYLGIQFTASGSFHFAQAELCKRALKAYYKLTKLPNSEQSYKGKVKTHNYINRQNQSTPKQYHIR
jgi:hypothetical protein